MGAPQCSRSSPRYLTGLWPPEPPWALASPPSLVAIRPKDKALANEADARKYAELRTLADGMKDADLERALAKARESDVAEIEPLRDVAWNDVVVEIGRPEVRG